MRLASSCIIQGFTLGEETVEGSLVIYVYGSISKSASANATLDKKIFVLFPNFSGSSNP